MDPPASGGIKLSDMVMCGDHPSYTKAELNVKKAVKEEDRPKDTTLVSYASISPSTSHAERAASEHARRGAGREGRVRPERHVSAAPGQALVYAALGSFRWPPYLLCVWGVVLVATHLLHCLIGLLERALPNLKNLCEYFRTWTEESWKTDTDLNHRVYPIALASLTGVLYVAYALLSVAHSVSLWAVEPLCPEDERPTEVGVKVTNYVDEVDSKTNSSVQH